MNDFRVIEKSTDPLLYTWTIPGANRRITCRRDIPGFLLMHYVLSYNDLCERLDMAGADPVDEGAWNNRNIAGTNTKSRHARALAVDLNWNKHPQGVPARKNMTKRQIDWVHSRMRWMNRAALGKKMMEWGGDWPSHAGSTAKPDPMHMQVNWVSKAALRAAYAIFSRTARGKRLIKANPKNKDHGKILDH